MELMCHRTYCSQLGTPLQDSFSLTVCSPRPLLNEILSSSYHPISSWVNTHHLHGGYCQLVRAVAGQWLLKQQVGSKFGQMHHTSYTQSDEQLQLDLHQGPQFCLCSSLWPEYSLGWTLIPASRFCLLMLCLCQEIFGLWLNTALALLITSGPR